MDATPVTLLERLRRHPSEKDWRRFVNLFAPILFRWARLLGAQDADAQDLVQSVLVKVHQMMPTFKYDPKKSFRNWLAVILRNQRLDQLKRPGRQVASPHELDALAGPEWTEDDDYAREIVGRCLQFLKNDFPKTWQAVWDTLSGDEPIKDVAARHGMTPNALAQARRRALHRLRSELHGLLP